MALSRILYVILKLSLCFPLLIMSHSICDLENCFHCDFIDESIICRECINGYYLDTQSECIKCNKHCLSCTISTCTECENNYKLSDSQCVLSFESESNKKEFVSLKGCLVYDKNNDCTKCSPGYQLKNGICDGTIITIVTIVVLSITVIAFLIFIVYIIFISKERNTTNNNVSVDDNNNQQINENVNNNSVTFITVAKKLNESLTSTQSRGLNCYK